MEEETDSGTEGRSIAEAILQKIINCEWFDFDAEDQFVYIDGRVDLNNSETEHLKKMMQNE